MKREEWNQHYAKMASISPQAARVLVENKHLLPTQGRALDLACGLGGNALLLASQGLKCDAYDQSPAAIQALQTQAEKRNLALFAKVRDVAQQPPTAMHYAVIVVSYFLHRPLFPQLIAALKPEGLLFYQTFSGPRILDRGPRNPAYRLQTNELLQCCADLEVLVYREESSVGDVSQGLRGEAFLVGRKKG